MHNLRKRKQLLNHQGIRVRLDKFYLSLDSCVKRSVRRL